MSRSLSRFPALSRVSKYLGEAEIHDLDGALFREHHVRRLDIAVEDAVTMRVGECFEDARDELNGLLDRESRLALKDLEIAFTGDELHRDEESVLLRIDVHVEHGDDIRMVELRGRLCFAQETLTDVFDFHELLHEHLVRHDAIQPRVFGTIDDAHAASADLLDELVTFAAELFFDNLMVRQLGGPFRWFVLELL